MFMLCSSVAKSQTPVKPQGNGVMREERTPSLDVRDVEDEDRGCQHAGQPDESRIGGTIHDESSRDKSCAKTPHRGLNFPGRRRDVINSF
jgi:hypothetical protein